MKNILVLGDSFSYGQGCSDRPTQESAQLNHIPSQFGWPSLLRADLNEDEYRLINLSKSGNSLMGMYLDLLHYHKYHVHTEPIHMVLFTITSFERMVVADPINPDNVVSWVLSSDIPNTLGNTAISDYNNAKRNFEKYLNNNTVQALHAIAYVNAFFNYTTTHNIKCLWSSPRIPELYGNFDWLKFSENLMFTNLYNYDFSKNFQDTGPYNNSFNKTCIIDDGHPNDKGHQIYYEHVIKPEVLKYIKENV
jgi:lysophospholipase L1-like esterase